MLTLVIMTNICKLNIHSQDFVAIQKQLTAHVAKLTKENPSFLMSELLTDTERIMIMKRYGAIFMYTQNHTPYRVSKTLGLSQPTTCRLFAQYQAGAFDNLMQTLRKKEQHFFLALINDLIAAQASPRARARLMNRTR